jgi:hypothetical protein
VGTVSTPLELHGSQARLFVRQIIEVVEGHCQTESYGYRLQADESIESWLIRWEYHRDPPRPDYSYPRAHVHVNGLFPNGDTVGKLHIPTRRLPLELVLWHLIAEWEIRSKTSNWRATLEESIEGFDERRTAE